MQIAPQATPQDLDQQAREFAATRLAEYLAGQPEEPKRQPRRSTFKGVARSSPEFHNEFLIRFLLFGKVSPILIDQASWQEFRALSSRDHPAQSRIIGLRKSRRICPEEFKRRCASCHAALSSNPPLTLTSQPPYTKLSRWVRERLPEKSVIKLLADWKLPQDALTVDILEWYILADELPIEDGGRSGASPCYPTIKPWGGHNRAMICFFRLPSHRAIRQIFQDVPAPKEWEKFSEKKRRKTGTRFIDEISDFVADHERQFEFPPSGTPEVIINEGHQKVQPIKYSHVPFPKPWPGQRCRCEWNIWSRREGVRDGCQCEGKCRFFDKAQRRCFSSRREKFLWLRKHKCVLADTIPPYYPPLEGDEPEGWIWLPKPPWKYEDIIKPQVWGQVMSESKRLPGPHRRLRAGSGKQKVTEALSAEQEHTYKNTERRKALNYLKARYERV